MDPALLRSRIFLAANAGGFLGFAALYSATAHVPLLIRGVRGGSAQEAGVALVPMSLAWVAASIVCGRLLLRIGYRRATGLGGLLVVAGCGGLAALPRDFGPGALVAALVLLGAGMGLAMTAFLVAVQAAAPPGRMGIATSSVQFFRTLGGAFGVAVMGAVLLGALRSLGVDAGTTGGAEALGGGGSGLPSGPLAAGLHRVFLTGLAFALGCLVAGAAMPGGDVRAMADPSRR